jgi:mRNA interferase RelE/StbE
VYRIVISSNPKKFLAKLREPERSRIASTMYELEQNPRPPGIAKVVGVELWRIREGNYRIVYDISDKDQIVTIVRIGHRREIYRDL